MLEECVVSPTWIGFLVAICTNAQPPTTAALSALMAGVGLLSSDQDLGFIFWLGMALIVTGVVLVQINH